MAYSNFSCVLAMLVVAFVVDCGVDAVSAVNFRTCRAPVHDTYRRYYLMYNSYGEGDYLCLRYKSVKSLGRHTEAGLDVPLECGNQRDGSTQLKLALDGAKSCAEQIAGGKACSLQTRYGYNRHQGLRLTGQEGPADEESLDRLYATHGSFVCIEMFGESRDAPVASVARCDNGRWVTDVSGASLNPVDRFSCRLLALSS